MIEVKDPDGAVVTHREFENSLVNINGQATGANLLAALLSGNWVVGPWTIVLQGSPGPCQSNPFGWCTIIPSNATALIAFTSGGCSTSLTKVSSGTQPYCYDNLMESLPGSGGYFTSFALAGAVYADQNATITGVETFQDFCPAGTSVSYTPGTVVAPTTTSPSACLATGGPGGGNAFTARTLDGNTVLGDPNPVPVIAGQTVTAAVTFSFQ
jgi:hypothetical protein